MWNDLEFSVIDCQETLGLRLNSMTLKVFSNLNESKTKNLRKSQVPIADGSEQGSHTYFHTLPGRQPAAQNWTGVQILVTTRQISPSLLQNHAQKQVTA